MATFCAIMWLASFSTLGSGLHWDAYIFYLDYPKVVSGAHGLPNWGKVGAHFNSLGLLAEMNYAAVFSLGSESSARLLSWIWAPSGGIILAALVGSVGGGIRAKIISLAMFFTAPAVLNAIGNERADVLALAMGLAAVYWILVARHMILPECTSSAPLGLIGHFANRHIA